MSPAVAGCLSFRSEHPTWRHLARILPANVLFHHRLRLHHHRAMRQIIPIYALDNELPAFVLPAGDDDVADDDERPRRPALNDEHEDLRECPRCGETMHRAEKRCPECGFRQPRNTARRVNYYGRRDAEPDRGGLILTLGIVGLASLLTCPVCPPVGTMAPILFGAIAWVLGRSDLAKMKRGEMDPHGESTTQAGRVCGIIAVVLGFLTFLGCGSFWLLVMLGNNQPPW